MRHRRTGSGTSLARIGVLAIGSLLAVWGFSSSYLYNWTLWGNYLITETYVSLRVEDGI